jgi:hypothetical protein
MMDAYVYAAKGEFWVSYVVAGVVVDEADGFADEAEAVEAARRNVYGFGTVYCGGVE